MLVRVASFHLLPQPLNEQKILSNTADEVYDVLKRLSGKSGPTGNKKPLVEYVDVKKINERKVPKLRNFPVAARSNRLCHLRKVFANFAIFDNSTLQIAK